MKPLKVTMQAFGPYTDRCEIDFEPLNKSGIFLITGPTGSGKTTILDAMCFALYGGATGENRQWDGMRNTSVDYNAPTIAEFEFSVGSDIYKFTRTREYRQKKRKAELVIEPDTKAYAYKFNDGQWTMLSDTSKSVSALATELLGFNREQFVQVIVLPQGEFKKLLTANSTEKSAILETLFGAKKWSVYAKRFSEKASETDKQLKELRHKIDGILSGVNAEDSSSLQQKLREQDSLMTELKEKSSQYNNQIKELSDKIAKEEGIKKSFEELDKILENLEQLNVSKQHFALLEAQTKEHQNILKVRPLYNAYIGYSGELHELRQNKAGIEKQLSQFKIDLDALNNNSEHIASIKAEKQNLLIKREDLQRALNGIDEYIAAENNLKSLEKERIALNDSFEKLTQQIEEKELILSNGEKEWENIKRSIDQIPSFKAEILKLDSDIKKLNELSQCRKEYDEALGSLSSLSKELDANKKLCEETETEYEQLKALFDKDSAYNLSVNLKDGLPCPVCGATHHPFPAVPAKNAPDQYMLDTAYKKTASAHRQYQSIEVKYKAEIARQKLIFDRLNVLQNDCRNIELDIDMLSSQRDSISEKLKRAEGMNHKRDQIEQRKKAREQEISALKDRLAVTSEEINKKALHIAGESAKLSQLKKQLSGDVILNKSEVASSKAQCDSRIIQIDKVCSEHDQKLSQCRQNISNLSGQLAYIDKAIINANEQCSRSENELNEACVRYSISDYSIIRNSRVTEDAIENNLRMLKEYNNSLLYNNERKEQLTSLLENFSRPDMSALYSEYNKLENERSCIVNSLGQAEKYHDMLLSAQKSIGNMAAQFDELSDQYSRIQRLALYLSGKNDMSTPIHQFVLGLMLEHVIQSANTYLVKLSKGQYSLRRVDREKGRRGYLGMEIDVIDAHRGGSRDVRTLSGGEIFLASLSLAFGLSDTVQSFSGGISIDSLFIDEGFGTLDSETLETAMKALAEIRLSGRIIGIISHVEEIKNRIAAHIEITKTSSGSSVSVHDLSIIYS